MLRSDRTLSSYPGTYPPAFLYTPPGADLTAPVTRLGWAVAVATDAGLWPVTFTFSDPSDAHAALGQVRRRFPSARIARASTPHGDRP